MVLPVGAVEACVFTISAVSSPKLPIKSNWLIANPLMFLTVKEAAAAKSASTRVDSSFSVSGKWLADSMTFLMMRLGVGIVFVFLPDV
jgi:hypothetical protein